MDLERLKQLALLRDPSYSSLIISEGARRNDPFLILVGEFNKVHHSSGFRQTLSKNRDLIKNLSNSDLEFLDQYLSQLSYKERFFPDKLENFSLANHENLIKLSRYFLFSKYITDAVIQQFSEKYPDKSRELYYSFMYRANIPICPIIQRLTNHGTLKSIKLNSSQVVDFTAPTLVDKVEFMKIDDIPIYSHYKLMSDTYSEALQNFVGLKHLKILNFTNTHILYPSMDILEIDNPLKLTELKHVLKIQTLQISSSIPISSPYPLKDRQLQNLLEMFTSSLSYIPLIKFVISYQGSSYPFEIKHGERISWILDNIKSKLNASDQSYCL